MSDTQFFHQTPLRAYLSTSTAGTTAVLPAVADQAYRITRIELGAGGAQTVTMSSGSTEFAKYFLAANNNAVVEVGRDLPLTLGVNQPLNVNLSGSVATSVAVWYYLA